MSSPRPIVVAVDLSPQSNRVCHAAADMAKCLGGELVLVYVVHELAALLGVYAQQSVRELQDNLERQGGERLRTLAKEHFAKLPHRCVLLVGTPWAEVLDCALRENARLVVMGTHSSEKPEHAFAGSTVKRVIDNARCQVLLVPPE